LEFAGQNSFEIISILIAAVALIYAALAFRASKQAIKATKESNVAALRVKVQEGISEVERSFLVLQESCLHTRREWESHASRHYPVLGSSFSNSIFSEPDETVHISKIERTGSKVFRELLSSVPEPNASAPAELHQFIERARCASTRIERLKLGLELPKPLRH